MRALVGLIFLPRGDLEGGPKDLSAHEFGHGGRIGRVERGRRGSRRGSKEGSPEAKEIRLPEQSKKLQKKLVEVLLGNRSH